MNQAEFDAAVERRVQEEIAKRESTERVSDSQREQKAKLDAGLRQLAVSANQEPANAYGSGRDFSRGRDLSKREGVQAGAWAVLDDFVEAGDITISEADDG